MRSNTQNFSFIFKVWKVYKYFKQHVNPSYIYLLAYLYKYSHTAGMVMLGICKHLVWIVIYYDCKIWHNIVTKIMIHHAIRYNFFCKIGILIFCNSSSAKVSHLGYDDAIDWYIPFSHIIIYRPVTLSCSHLDMFFYIFIISSSPHSVWKENTEIRDRLSTRYGHNLQTLLYLQYGF